jgi:hypothetical protein
MMGWKTKIAKARVWALVSEASAWQVLAVPTPLGNRGAVLQVQVLTVPTPLGNRADVLRVLVVTVLEKKMNLQ